MKIYNVNKIKQLYNSIEDRLNFEEKEIVKEILGNYNLLYNYAKDKKLYLERKEDQYVRESNENDKFRERIKFLEEKLAVKETIIVKLRKEIKDLKKNIIIE